MMGVLLGGAIDAAACEPESQTISLVDANVGQQHQDSQDAGHGEGVCVHGHCHHCAQNAVRTAAVDAVMFLAAAPVAADQAILLSIVGSSLKRPPRV